MIELNVQKKLGSFHLNLSLSTTQNRIGILGASGCGKSMTLKCIAGIETPDSGLIRLDGRTLFDSAHNCNLRPQERRVGYLFQNYALFPTMTVAQNIAAPLHGSKRQRLAQAEQVMEQFHLTELARHYPSQLSGGQQQRTALARMMACQPEVILLDEPFSALDAYLKEQLQLELLELLKDCSIPMILVSHNRDEIYRFCDHVLLMEDGRSAQFCSVHDLFADPQTAAAARLTGCKNIAAAKRLDAYHITVPTWGMVLKTAVPVPEDCAGVGIRAHDLLPCQPDTENAFVPELVTRAEMPFETHYLLRPAAAKDKLWWKVPRLLHNRPDSAALPAALCLPPEQLLLLRRTPIDTRVPRMS